MKRSHATAGLANKTRARAAASRGQGVARARMASVCLGCCVAASACQRKPQPPIDHDRSSHPEAPPLHAPPPEEGAGSGGDGEGPQRVEELAHHVVYADRLSHVYLLLLPEIEGPPVLPEREQIATLLSTRFADRLADRDVIDLIEMVRRVPDPAPVGASGRTPGAGPGAIDELLGIDLEILSVTDAQIPAQALSDPIATRFVDAQIEPNAAGRRWALLIRGEYRNRHNIRGLRLLQRLVGVMASDKGALIHDPDLRETYDPAHFDERALRSDLSNVASQIVVLPFPDETDDGRIRLATRGLRRFGCVDLELDGLAKDLPTLERGTWLLLGLAAVLVGGAELDDSGFAVEVEEALVVVGGDVRRAHGSPSGHDVPCARCSGEVVVHLVERPARATDAVKHPVARVVAPREFSDAPDYDHRAWVGEILTELVREAGEPDPHDPHADGQPAPNRNGADPVEPRQADGE